MLPSFTFIKSKESEISFVVPSFFVWIYDISNLKFSFDPIFQDYHFETCHKVETPLPLKQNKRVLSSQALNLGRSLGQGLALSGHHNTAVRGYHVCKEQELKNAVNKFAVKVVKNNQTVSHFPHGYLWILWYFSSRKICVEVTGCRNSWKSQWTTATHSQFLLCLFLDILRSFIKY